MQVESTGWIWKNTGYDVVMYCMLWMNSTEWPYGVAWMTTWQKSPPSGFQSPHIRWSMTPNDDECISYRHTTGTLSLYGWVSVLWLRKDRQSWSRPVRQQRLSGYWITHYYWFAASVHVLDSSWVWEIQRDIIFQRECDWFVPLKRMNDDYDYQEYSLMYFSTSVSIDLRK